MKAAESIDTGETRSAPDENTPRRAAPVDPGPSIFDSRPQLQDPRAFLGRAAKDISFSARLAPALFRMQLRSRRRANLFGWLWLVLPIATTIAIGLALQALRPFPLPNTGISYAAFLTAGIALWQTLAEALSLPLQQLSANRHALTRLRMPVEAPVFAGLIELAVNTGIRMLLVLLALPLLGAVPGLSILALPMALVGLAALGLLIGLVVAPAGILIDDIGRGLMLVAGLWMIASPVLYPTSAYPGLGWNPAAPLIEAGRAAMTGQPVPGAAWAVAVLCLLALVPALLWLRLARPHFIDRLS